MARLSTVAVVVPSPATSEVLEATSLTIWAPMFSNLSSSSISLATVTPSLVTVGAPRLFSKTTFRPLGPRVTITASARMFTPRSTLSRASPANLTSFAAMFLGSLDESQNQRFSPFDHAENVALPDDQMLLAVQPDVTPSIAEQNPITGHNFWRH